MYRWTDLAKDACCSTGFHQHSWAITTGKQTPPCLQIQDRRSLVLPKLSGLKQSHTWEFSLVFRGSRAQGADVGMLLRDP